jgi:glycosyltransferase involved in cell wall biosynthesis
MVNMHPSSIASGPARPLRILMINSARQWVGEAAHTLALARALQARGHFVALGVRHGFALEEQARACGYDPIIPLHFNSRFHPLRDAEDFFAIRRIIREDRIDLVHCHRGKDHWIAAAARFPGHSPRIVRTRHVVTQTQTHIFNRWLYRSATDGLISVSQAAERSLDPLIANIPDERRRVIYSSVDSERFHPGRRSAQARAQLGVPEHALLVGLIARLQRVKGQRHFLRAAALLAQKHPDAVFLVAGRGGAAREDEVRRQATEAGLPAGQLRVAGILPDLPETMASLDIGVVASIGSEGSSRIAMEYMASGCPIVATTVGSLPELVHENIGGYLVPPRDPQALADRIGQLLASLDLRLQLGNAGRETAISRFSPTRWVEEVESIYRGSMTNK